MVESFAPRYTTILERNRSTKILKISLFARGPYQNFCSESIRVNFQAWLG